MLEFIAMGPGRKTGFFYAGYIRPNAPGTFVPLVDCNTLEQAETAAAELHRQAIEREQKYSENTKLFNARLNGDVRTVRGFYNDGDME